MSDSPITKKIVDGETYYVAKESVKKGDTVELPVIYKNGERVYQGTVVLSDSEKPYSENQATLLIKDHRYHMIVVYADGTVRRHTSEGGEIDENKID